jgi:hypothetical protein
LVLSLSRETTPLELREPLETGETTCELGYGTYVGRGQLLSDTERPLSTLTYKAILPKQHAMRQAVLLVYATLTDKSVILSLEVNHAET